MELCVLHEFLCVNRRTQREAPISVNPWLQVASSIPWFVDDNILSVYLCFVFLLFVSESEFPPFNEVVIRLDEDPP